MGENDNIPYILKVCCNYVDDIISDWFIEVSDQILENIFQKQSNPSNSFQKNSTLPKQRQVSYQDIDWRSTDANLLRLLWAKTKKRCLTR